MTDLRMAGPGPAPRSPAAARQRGRHRRTRPVVGRRFRRFAVAAAAAFAASQLTLTVLLGPLRWTAGTAALIAWLIGAATSYLVSRWAWERRGRPRVLRETVPFWVVSLGTAAVLTVATKYANQRAIAMGLSHGQQVLLADGAYFAANVVTFLCRFLIFHYLLFADRKPGRIAPAGPATAGPLWAAPAGRPDPAPADGYQDLAARRAGGRSRARAGLGVDTDEELFA